jgi:hypothetical protein
MHAYTKKLNNRCFQIAHLCISMHMDELTGSIQDEVTCCMLFAYDIILVDDIRHGVNVKLEI